MCGIIGCVTDKNINVKNVLINGLEKLEYRGYDSAGICLIESGKVIIEKQVGALVNLKKSTKNLNSTAKIGIGHTRWATHGKPVIKNCHPHTGESKKFIVVHNGIIENYSILKNELIKKGIKFDSDTDSEVIAKLLEFNFKNDFLKCVKKTIKRLKGSFALGIICTDYVDTLVAVRRFSPLIVCKNKDGLYLASDVPALIDKTNKMFILKDDEIAVMQNNSIKFFDFDLKPLNKTETIIHQKSNNVTRRGYNTFMEKEINDIPRSLKDTLDFYSSDKFDEAKLTKFLMPVNFIYFVACGTAYHAGTIGANLIEKYVGIRTKAVVASEFRYFENIIDENTLCIFISQSGETADTISALKKAKSQGAKVIAITNVPTSSITRECEVILPTLASVEIAVASTKAYNTQVLVLYLLTLFMAKEKNKPVDFNKEDLTILTSQSKKLTTSTLVTKIIDANKHLKQAFFIGRDLDYLTAMEGSLKLKEISYLSCEAYPSGELKHGTLALIDDATLVVAIITNHNLKEKTLSGVHEVKARGAKVLIISPFKFDRADWDYFITLPKLNSSLMPILSVIPLQQLALDMSLKLGYNPDKPRNLAKSVTVE